MGQINNGSNIRGASRELLGAFDELEINKEVDELTIRLIHVPHFSIGGSWERMIGSFKRALNGRGIVLNPITF